LNIRDTLFLGICWGREIRANFGFYSTCVVAQRQWRWTSRWKFSFSSV